MSTARHWLWPLIACLWLTPVAGAERATPTALDPARRETLADMLLRLEQMQAELRELRGQVEVQAHEIEVLKERQRDLLADIDRRVGDLERRGATGPAAAGDARDGRGGATPGTVAGAAAGPGATAAPGEAAAAALAKEQQEYDAAFSLLKQGQYGRASRQFRAFVEAHPKSPLVDNAQYWIGESAYVVRNFKLALEEFSRIVQDHPGSPKAPDALLKVGYCQYELAEWGKARETLNQVVSRYPNTPVARSAEQRLARMKKEGR